MNAKHTPGPWKASPASSVVGSLIASDHEGVCCNVAAVMPQAGRRSKIYDPEETMANAHLVAAAPDMLEACRAAIAVLDEITERFGFNCSADRRIILAAIAKAEGRS